MKMYSCLKLGKCILDHWNFSDGFSPSSVEISIYKCADLSLGATTPWSIALWVFCRAENSAK